MQTYNTPTAITAVLDVPAGHLRFIAAERTDTLVEVRPVDASKARDVKAAERTTIEFADGVLRVETPEKNAAFGPTGTVEVTVQLPAGSRIQATGSAELRGAGRLGEVSVQNAYGPIKLDEATTAQLGALDGDITIGRLTGPAEVSTARGDVRVGEALQGTLALSTQLGNVSVGVPAGVTASLNAGTPYGRISNALANTGGAPVVEIHATTASGDIDAHTV
ncbi:DUF4097 family beta strand repeat-containing protein [Leifsonia poae]|uniref:DUF4097 domain-containing protein n=1 Tax=Leifsonia poae TaxID=110933 RepID=A0A9W6HC20_9MICO|nr:DUF4097 family beta strand repeat-containing protein [Leifsonia poae]GLJ77366.1 hypothetical protein GCM10017584_29400 [Leifsonia poae]